MTLPATSLHVPMFLTQLSQKTLVRLGIDMQDWERFVSRALACDFSADLRNGDAMNAFVDYASFRRLVRLAQRMVGSESLLRWYTGDMRLVHLGPLGVAALTAPTVGESVDVWARFGSLMSPALSVTRRDTHQQTILSFRPLGEVAGVDRFLAEIHLLTLKRQIEYVAQKPGSVTVRFADSPAASRAFYKAEFGDSVTFDAAENVVVVPRNLFSAINESHVPLGWRHALGLCTAMSERAQRQVSVAHRVREAMLAGGPQGSCALKDVAARLHVSVRTLARRLADTGVTFREIQSDVRIELAKRQLRDTRLPIKVICGNAGFTNLSAFSRAFRKMTDQTPSGYRECSA